MNMNWLILIMIDGFVDFYDLPEDPVIEKTFNKGGKDIHIFHLNHLR